MTRSRLIALRERRAHLVERARAERAQLGATLLRIESSLSWIDVLKRVGSEIRSHPLAMLAALVVLAALRPRRAIKLVGGGWGLWQAYQRLRRLWALAVGIAAGRAPSRT